MADGTTLLRSLPSGFVLRAPVAVEIHRGVHVTASLPGTICYGSGATEEGALAKLRWEIAWWLLHEHERYKRRALPKRLVPTMRAILALVESPDPQPP